MKKFLITFIQRNWFRCTLLLLLLEPIFRDHIQFTRVLFYGILFIVAIYLIYSIINFFRKVKYNDWKNHRKSKEFLLLDIYICCLGILSQYLTTPDWSTFFSHITYWLLFLSVNLIDFIPDRIGKIKKKN